MWNVLLVDDEPFILEGLELIIDWVEYGLNIYQCASNGHEALEIIKHSNIHIIVTDIRMPFMNGLELIEATKEIKPGVRFIILSGYDDFQYVKTAAKFGIENYLLKPVIKEELSSTLLATIENLESEKRTRIDIAESRNILRSNILYRLMNNLITIDELNNKSSIIGINTTSKHYAASIIKIINASNPCVFENKSAIYVLNVFESLFSNNNYGTAFFEINGDIALLLHDGITELNTDIIMQLLQKGINSASVVTGSDFFATIGSLETNIMKVSSSYKNAKTLQEFWSVMPSNKILIYDEVTCKRSNGINFNMDMSVLKGYLTDNSKEKVCDFIRDVFARLCSTDGILPSDMHKVTFDLLICILNESQVYKHSSNTLYKNIEDVFRNIYDMYSIDQIVNELLNIVDLSMNFLSDKNSTFSAMTKRVLSYIDANYGDSEISLKTLASEFNVNAAYLGQMFKRETGHIFSSYLASIRIEKAKKLLKENSLKANKISELVGFTDPNYFYRTFKKITNYSISQYLNDLHYHSS